MWDGGESFVNFKFSCYYEYINFLPPTQACILNIIDYCLNPTDEGVRKIDASFMSSSNTLNAGTASWTLTRCALVAVIWDRIP
jgi:hypothetical protein